MILLPSKVTDMLFMVVNPFQYLTGGRLPTRLYQGSASQSASAANRSFCKAICSVRDWICAECEPNSRETATTISAVVSDWVSPFGGSGSGPGSGLRPGGITCRMLWIDRRECPLAAKSRICLKVSKSAAVYWRCRPASPGWGEIISWKRSAQRRKVEAGTFRFSHISPGL